MDNLVGLCCMRFAYLILFCETEFLLFLWCVRFINVCTYFLYILDGYWNTGRGIYVSDVSSVSFESDVEISTHLDLYITFRAVRCMRFCKLLRVCMPVLLQGVMLCVRFLFWKIFCVWVDRMRRIFFCKLTLRYVNEIYFYSPKTRFCAGCYCFDA